MIFKYENLPLSINKCCLQITFNKLFRSCYFYGITTLIQKVLIFGEFSLLFNV